MSGIQELYSLEAEQSLLSCIMKRPDVLTDVRPAIRTADFYRQSNSLLYECMLALDDDGTPIDNVTVVEQLRKTSKLEAVGGITGVMHIYGLEYSAANAMHYADIVRSYAQRRDAFKLGEKLQAIAADCSEDLNLDSVQQEMADIVTHRAKGVESAADMMLSFSGWLDERASHEDCGVLTGFQDVDEMAKGVEPTDLAYIAGRPGMGKSAFAVQYAINAASKGMSVAIFSLEMSREQLLSRIIGNMAKLNISMVMHPRSLTDESWAKILAAQNAFSKMKFAIEGADFRTPAQIRARARQIMAVQGLDLLIVDHVHLMESGLKTRNLDNRNLELTHISRSLKIMAMDLNVAVVALAQLSRAIEARQDKRPMMSDLRDSGSLEQDADQIYFLYREKYYKQDLDDDVVEIILRKCRNGEPGTARLKFMPQYSQFQSLPTQFGREVPL